MEANMTAGEDLKDVGAACKDQAGGTSGSACKDLARAIVVDVDAVWPTVIGGHCEIRAGLCELATQVQRPAGRSAIDFAPRSKINKQVGRAQEQNGRLCISAQLVAAPA